MNAAPAASAAPSRPRTKPELQPARWPFENAVSRQEIDRLNRQNPAQSKPARTPVSLRCGMKRLPSRIAATLSGTAM
jgi:hypothetical protein